MKEVNLEDVKAPLGDDPDQAEHEDGSGRFATFQQYVEQVHTLSQV